MNVCHVDWMPEYRDINPYLVLLDKNAYNTLYYTDHKGLTKECINCGIELLIYKDSSIIGTLLVPTFSIYDIDKNKDSNVKIESAIYHEVKSAIDSACIENEKNQYNGPSNAYIFQHQDKQYIVGIVVVSKEYSHLVMNITSHMELPV